MFLKNGSWNFKGQRPLNAHRSTPSACPGFTLLEILITIAILAVLATMVYASFDASIKVIERVDKGSDKYREARFIISRLSEELSMAFRPKDNSMPEAIFVGQNSILDGRAHDSLRFTSLSHFRSVPDQAASDFNLIEYSLETSPDGNGWVLLHKERDNLYELSGDSFSQGGGGQFVIGEDIHGLNLRYFDGKTWLDSWNAENEKGLPKVVEIKIDFGQAQGDERSFKSWVELPLAR